MNEPTREKIIGPIPEVTFDGRRFLAMTRNIEFFRQQLPRVVGEVVTGQPFPVNGPPAKTAQKQMYDEARRIWNDGSHILLMRVYGNWAKDKGIEEVERDVGRFGRIKTLKRIDELTPDQQREWDTYLDTVDFPREVAVEALRNLRFELPSMKYLDDPSVNYLNKRLSVVPYALVLAILPDISDNEAKQLFGQLTTAEKVRQLAADPSADVSVQ